VGRQLPGEHDRQQSGLSGSSDNNWNIWSGGGGCGSPDDGVNGNNAANLYLKPESQGGGLTINATDRSSTNPDGPWDTAQLDTSNTAAANLEYGSIQASIELPAGFGFCPAFWMAGDPIGGTAPPPNSWSPPQPIPAGTDPCWDADSTSAPDWAYCGEADIVEAPNSSSGNPAFAAYYDLHGPMASNCQPGEDLGGQCQQWNQQGTSALSGYNTYGLVWTPTTVTFTLNGVPQYSVSQSQIDGAGDLWELGPDNGVPGSSSPGRKYKILLDLAVGGWPGNPTSPAAEQMNIAWVRWYQDCTGNPGYASDGCPA
jgi:beta-glucanase (GH16 family)